MTPFFSIIIPVYNVAPYLRECLDSVLAQVFTDWEAICVDDGSTDDSGAILDEYAVKDKRFRVYHKLNEGVAVARNFALDQARGEYIGFIDGDDLVARGMLDTIFGVIRQHPDIDWITMLGWFAIGNEVDFNFPQEDTLGAVEIVDGNAVQPWGFNKITHVGLMWLNYYRKDAFAHVRFQPGIRYGEDDVILLEALQYIKVAAAIKYKGYLYRIARPGAASRIVTMHDVLILIENMHRVVRPYVEYESDSERRNSLRNAVGWFVDKFIFRGVLMCGHNDVVDKISLINEVCALDQDVNLSCQGLSVLHALCLKCLITFRSFIGYKLLARGSMLKHRVVSIIRGGG